MSQSNKISDNLSRLFGGGLSLIGNLKKEFDQNLKSKMQDCMRDVDLVSKKEYKILYEMVSKMRIEQEEINKKITNLEQIIKIR